MRGAVYLRARDAVGVHANAVAGTINASPDDETAEACKRCLRAIHECRCETSSARVTKRRRQP